MPARVTLRDLARETGLHFTTVGLALRRDSRISAATRTLVEEAARRHGYRPDALLSALSSYRHGNRPFLGTIGYLLPAPLPQLLARQDGYRITFQAATSAAAAVGLKVEPINAFAPGMSGPRLAQLLEARGIRALTLAPLFEPGCYPELPWERFSVVAIGYSVLAPAFHRVGPHQARSTRELVETLRRRGYRRIGMILDQNANIRTGYNFLGAYLAEQEGQPAAQRLRPLLAEQAKIPAGELRRWFRQQKPDCVIGTGPEYLEQLRDIGAEIPAKVGFALTGIRPKFPHIAGMDERWDGIGQAVVDLALSLLRNHETGVPRFPRFGLVNGQWVEGRTVVRPPDRTRI
jgi:DNA-binding LacI/PurR family transcriptional regulator